jgi:hypothetical protein
MHLHLHRHITTRNLPQDLLQQGGVEVAEELLVLDQPGGILLHDGDTVKATRPLIKVCN